MNKHKAHVAITHMLNYAKEAVALAQNRSRVELDTNRMLNLSLVRLLEIVGEAARRVPEETQACHPNIPWTQIISLRNRLIHGYDSIDLDILWAILTEDLHPLIAKLEHILAEGIE